MPEETIKNITNEEFFQNFINVKEKTANLNIAKEQDKINALEVKITSLQATQANKNEAINACKTFIDNNSFPKLNPIVSVFSQQLTRSVQKNNNQIKKAKNKIKKANKKIKKLNHKQKRCELLKSFFSSIQSSDNKQAAYIDGMRALREDSLIRSEKQLDKVISTLDKLNNKLNGELKEVDKIKFGARVKKLESKRDKLVAKINNLNELDQDLNKLAKIELIDDKVKEIANTAVETGEKVAMESSSISKTIDSLTENSNSVIEAVLEPKKTEEIQTVEATKEPRVKKSADIEKQSKPVENKNSAFEIKNVVKKTGVTQKQALKILNTGIPIQAIKTSDNECTILFDRSNAENVNKIFQETQNKKIKR